MPIDLEPGQRVRMRWDEYARLGPVIRGEYIDGELVVSPLASRRHQEACWRLISRLKRELPDGVDVAGSWGWKPAEDEFGPDVMVFDETTEDVRYTGVPHLCVEVLSTDHAADLVRKFAKYGEAGLRRYWVVDLDLPEVIVFELDPEAGYREVARVTGEHEATLDVGVTTVRLSPAELVD